MKIALQVGHADLLPFQVCFSSLTSALCYRYARDRNVQHPISLAPEQRHEGTDVEKVSIVPLFLVQFWGSVYCGGQKGQVS